MEELEREYHKILSDYIKDQNERNLYIGQNFVRQLIRRNVAPEDVVSLHKEAVEEIFPEEIEGLRTAYDFLIEMMVHYGMALREHQSLIQKQAELQIEMNIAANVQKTMLQTTIPTSEQVEIGMVSTPLKTVNGDYVHFIEDDRYVGVAVTDVVGKGVPAALCMSMVKYGLETMRDSGHTPSRVLSVLNRIVEQNVDDSMFISMFYGCYVPRANKFYYGSAGHEPAFLYRAQEDKFYDLEANGILLGIIPTAEYIDNEVVLHKDDMVIVVTDGVTEFRQGDDIDERGVVASLINDVKHLAPQQICEYLYRELEELHEFNLRDDFTVVVIKKR
ncbi:PP2C family protein-serine/threonine phosphatase [Metalysinibacillus jejuensis]|uniref:PP2C family protein-serine/threonine phosphatase n=1 Tax=Metalysinibacillus jejuensis TaxID=914327 RepID=UPI000D33F9FE|nr:PP2C family protein-serine/threonine phosphatase [Metalysinibacillus jejuensis]